ncbi:MAG: inositol monophosphatase [Rickettsia endosymbiont of Ixodes persulcatus]|nr:inositol monophosphatase [Rickettsia endosymbiont of Ixodes persulcatus]MCZ6901509.1 inositol monophosphatase [Rickettsia endosymbiont of Ixodes persulcatus]MCZ6903224.1 inositol monophosphatase [Rickettsia endosymbiont of Ixodes persulcatus]MCZ6908533.1 inositol monophosphatase [Rickettsia endosymbiont of Ixodes persulcatus]MCZ6909610.1 inositol monophosphatase [Rickettsia endosymbiont of Ixodes persulcatus]
MHPITNLLINAMRKAVKFLHRDFLELEMLQKSSIRNEEFCKRSYLKLKTLLCEELQKHTQYLFFPEDKFDLNNNYESIFLINPIDSSNNFARSIPFFAISVTYFKRNQGVLTPASTVIYFPALNEIYYAEKGKGAWIEKNNLNSNYQGLRLRVSDNADLKNCLAIIEDLKHNNWGGEVDNIRSFGSPCYAATLVASGKADLICLSLLNFTLYYAFELLIKEAGGIIIDSSDKFIYSNRYIAKKLKKY